MTPSPWDEKIFGVPAWEIHSYNENAILQALNIPGHYTLRVDPLADKGLLHENGFYYCDTLIKPYCDRDKFINHSNAKAMISMEYDESKLLEMSRQVFQYGRFHRDFMLDRCKADDRYQSWLKGLINTRKVNALFWQESLAGFIAQEENVLILHALSRQFQGKGYAKFWWSQVSRAILDSGFSEVVSSISASNLNAVNLYASLGYRFREPKDLYHRLVV